MANNDEYEYVESDMGGSELTQNKESEPSRPKAAHRHPFSDQKNIKRNALIAAAGLVFIIVFYNVMHSLPQSKQTERKATMNPASAAITVKKNPVVAVPSQPTPTVLINSSASNAMSAQMNNKLSSLELSQQTMQAELASTKDQLLMLNNNMTDLSSKITDINRNLVLLQDSLEAKSKEMAMLTQKMTPVKPVRSGHHRTGGMHAPPLKYYLQAVIPGRAWLIATNGTTLTVREGTVISGYGVVRLIDPRQGRVVTGSGHVIRFSPEDS